MSATLQLAKELIQRDSVTPNDRGCQEIIGERLRRSGFACEHMKFGDVDNLWARRGTQAPLFVFAGHTDVVPTGPMEDWDTPPFQPTVREGRLFGRGAADMKGSLAAMVTAVERYVAAVPRASGSIGFLLTSDEEGPAINGTVRVMETLSARGEHIDMCLVGEPSCTERIGDTVKIGRRGSLTGRLRIFGTQGHVAYPHHTINPIHTFAPALLELTSQTWDGGNESFPPTTFQVTNMGGGTGATNVIPGALDVMFNFRFSTEATPQSLEERLTTILNRYDLRYRLSWELSGLPFLTASGPLLDGIRGAIKDVTGTYPDLSTSGGTSDGRFIAPTGTHVIEFGPINQTIHKVNENVTVNELDYLSNIYETLLKHLFASESA